MKLKRNPLRYYWKAFALIGLVLLFVIVQWVVQTFQKPGHMGVIESQTMEMTVQPPEGAMPVQTEVIQPRPFASSVTYTANVTAFNDIAIYPRVDGRIVGMPVYPGERVQTGQLLAQLDTRELTSRVNEAKAGQAAATQQYYASIRQQKQAIAQAQRAQQAIEATRMTLQFRQAQVQRSRTLVAEDVITPEEAQRDEADYSKALSEYQQAQSDLMVAQQGGEAATFQSQAQFNQARQAAAIAQTQQIIKSYTHITSPQSGVVTERLVSPGTLVNPSMKILQLAQIHPIRIQANVAESDLQSIRLGSPVTIWEQKNQTQKAATAKVTAIFPRADLQTRTAIVEAVIDNQEERFIPGDFVTVSIQTGVPRKTLTVPNSALINENGQQAVWTVIDGKTHLQFVTTGGTNGKRTAILNGLKPGDTVIIQGNQNLVEGVMITQGEYGPQGLKVLPKTMNTNRLGKTNQYRIQRMVGMYIATVTLENKPPRVGRNTLLVSVVSGPGMSMPLNKISLDMTARMPSMSTMSVPKPAINKTEDGQFKANVMLSMPGLWQVTVTVKSGGQTLGTFLVEVEVPE